MRFSAVALVAAAVPAIVSAADYWPALAPFPAISCGTPGAVTCRADALNLGGAGGCCDAGSFCCGGGCVNDDYTCVIIGKETKICEKGKDCGADIQIAFSGTARITSSISRTAAAPTATTSSSASTTASAAAASPTGDAKGAGSILKVTVNKVVVVGMVVAGALAL